MAKLSKSYFIDRPINDVFNFVTDPANDHLWRESTSIAEWITDAPVGVGSKMRSKDHFLGRTIEYVLEITAWDPPKLYSTKSVGGPIPVDVTFWFSIEGNGTRILIEGDIELGGLFKMAEGLIKIQFDKQFEKEWGALTRILEGEK